MGGVVHPQYNEIMTLQEFKEAYSVNQVKVFDALIKQVKDCTSNEFGYLSDVLLPKGMSKKIYNGIVKEFMELDLIYSTEIEDGYSINKNMEGCFDVVISKEEEIKLLKSLVTANGYFAEFFKPDFDQMKKNIENDFPIEHATKFYSVVDVLKENHKSEKYSLCETMLCVASETSNESLYQRVVDMLGLNAVIKLKRLLGLDLESKEIDYLVSKLDVEFN